MAPSSSQRQDAPDPPRHACIPLAHKRVPTEMRAPADHAHLLYAALVGEYDISHLRAQLTQLPVENWQEAYNRKHNVYFQRPFHDKLGVENIMCIFSDTQLENVFVLPRYEEYRAHLEQIFKAMDVHPDQVGLVYFRPMENGTQSRGSWFCDDDRGDRFVLCRWCDACSRECRAMRSSRRITTMGGFLSTSPCTSFVGVTLILVLLRYA